VIGRSRRKASQASTSPKSQTTHRGVSRNRRGNSLFVVNGLRQLLDDDHFVTLLRAEAMHTLPKPLAERLGRAEG